LAVKNWCQKLYIFKNFDKLGDKKQNSGRPEQRSPSTGQQIYCSNNITDTYEKVFT
jgi:hypothetical protein